MAFNKLGLWLVANRWLKWRFAVKCSFSKSAHIASHKLRGSSGIPLIHVLPVTASHRDSPPATPKPDNFILAPSCYILGIKREEYNQEIRHLEYNLFTNLEFKLRSDYINYSLDSSICSTFVSLQNTPLKEWTLYQHYLPLLWRLNAGTFSCTYKNCHLHFHILCQNQLDTKLLL